MADPKTLSDDELNDITGATGASPEWRYVPVRRFSASAGTGSFALPEVGDEVLVAAAAGDAS